MVNRSIPDPRLRAMNRNCNCKLITSTILLSLICSFNVIEGCSRDSTTVTTVKAPASAASEEPTTEKSLYTPYYNATTLTPVKKFDGYLETIKTWYNTTNSQCKFVSNNYSIMPANGLDNCKKKCNENNECTAIEYADANDCCKLLACPQPVPDPTVTQAPHHGGSFKYKGYKKDCGGCDEKMGANVCTETGCVCGSEEKPCLSTGSTPKCFSSNNTFTQKDINATCKCSKTPQDSCKSADIPSDPTTPVCGAEGVCVKCTKSDGKVGDGSEPGTCTGGMMGRYFNCYATGECKF